MAEQPEVDEQRDALLHALRQAQADFVLIGGAALESHGQPHRTDDIDVAPSPNPANLRRFADLLNGLDCKLVVDPADNSLDVPLPPDFFTARNLADQWVWNLNTRHGKLDLALRPSGFPDGYEQLCGRAQPLTVARTTVTAYVAALADVERSKRIAGRPKDLDYLQRVGRINPPDRPTRPG